MIFLSPETGSRTFHNTSSRVSDKPTLKMDITFILIFFVVFLISAVLLSKPKRLPPGPVSLPVLGPVSLIREFVTGIKRPHIVLYEAAKKYGNIMSFKLGCERIVVLSGYDTIHEALVKQSDVFSDRPPLAITKMFTKDGGGTCTGPEVIKLFSCSTQLSKKIFIFLFINVKMPTIVGILTFMSRKNSILVLSESEKKLNFLIIFILMSV